VSSDDTSFLPEHLDQQIEQPAERLAPDDQRLVQDLWHAYQGYEQMNTQSLQRVWSRLERERQKQPAPDTARTAPIALSQKEQNMRNTSLSDSTSQSGIRRTLSLLAAGLAIAVLVGSAAFVFNMVGKKNNHNNIGSSATQAISTPVVNASGIYITYPSDSSHEAVSKLDPLTHKPLWVYRGGYPDTETPTIYGNTVYLNSTGGQSNWAHLVALDANTGKVRWDAPLKTNLITSGSFLDTTTTPVVADGQVYVMNRLGVVFSFDTATGKQNWTYAAEGSAQADGTIYDSGAPVVSNGVLYGALHNTYFAVNAKTGQQLWSRTLEANDQRFNAIQVLDGVIYDTSYIASGHHAGMSLQSYAYAFNAKDGQQLWKYPTQTWVTFPLSIADGHVYFIERSPDFTDSGIAHSTLHALNLQGKEVWHKDYNTDVAGSPVAGDGYVSISEGTYNQGQVTSYTLHVYHAANGNVAWEQHVVTDPASIQNGVLYTIASRQIIAYDLASKKELWRGLYGVDLVDKMGNHSARLFTVVVIP